METMILELGGIDFMVNYHWEDPADDGVYGGDVGCIGRDWLPPAPYVVVDEVFKDDDGTEWTHLLSNQAFKTLKDEIQRITDKQD